MKQIIDIFNGNIVLEEPLFIKGIVDGDITVQKNGSLELKGLIDGQLTVKENGKATLKGTVNGDVINKGGDLKIYGIVYGKVINEQGTTFIDPHAIVHDDSIKASS